MKSAPRTRRNQRRKRAPRRQDARSSASLFPRDQQLTTLRLRYGQLVPDKLIVPMKYVQSVILSSASGAQSYTFSMNSVYDPNVTSTGGSVVGFTPLAGLYQRYRVTSSAIRVNFTTTDDAAIAVSLAPSSINVGSTTSAEVIAGLKHAKPRILRVLPAAGYGPSVVLEDSSSIAAIRGERLYDEQDLFGSESTDPALQFYWMIGTSCINNPAYTCNITVEVEYLTEWSLANDLGF